MCDSHAASATACSQAQNKTLQACASQKQGHARREAQHAAQCWNLIACVGDVPIPLNAQKSNSHNSSEGGKPEGLTPAKPKTTAAALLPLLACLRHALVGLVVSEALARPVAKSSSLALGLCSWHAGHIPGACVVRAVQLAVTT